MIGMVGNDSVANSSSDELTNRQRSAYRTHQIRTEESEAQIVESIRTLVRLGKKVTKAEVARMTGLSRVHISRRYAYLFR